MKKLYWHVSKVSYKVYLLIGILSILGMTLVEVSQVVVRQPYYQEKILAAGIMQSGLETLRFYRNSILGESYPLNKRTDPTGSGLIGLLTSPITSSQGSLEAKRASINPNWAAVLVEALKKAKVKEGDTVAMGFSGSFPAINLAALSAAEALKLKAIIITSVASSGWGANLPQFTWLDMEKILKDNKIISNTSVAASLGGRKDQAKEMTKEGRELLMAAISRHQVELFPATKNRKSNLDLRMTMYKKYAAGKPIAAYINVGSGIISVGLDIGKKQFRPGLNLKAPDSTDISDSLLKRFSQEGVPVIHMWPISSLAQEYELPLAPSTMPQIGEGRLFSRMSYRLPLVIGVLLVLILSLYAFIRKDLGYRLFTPRSGSEESIPPEPMV